LLSNYPDLIEAETGAEGRKWFFDMGTLTLGID